MPSFEQVSLRTERLVLRPVRDTDAPALFAIFSEPRVTRYLSTGPWDSIEQAHQRIARDAQALQTGESLQLGLERLPDGKCIGTCAFFHLDAQCRRAELGYVLALEAWGAGYMNEALVRLLDFGFTEWNLNRIEADVDPRNEPSVRTLERLGFQREGILRERWLVEGEVQDTALHGLLRSEWSRR